MDELVFTRELDNRIYPHKQLAHSYFIANHRLINNTFEIRPITIGHILCAIVRNYARIVYWASLRLLYKLGFIEISEAEAFSWKNNFRWIPKRKYKVD